MQGFSRGMLEFDNEIFDPLVKTVGEFDYYPKPIIGEIIFAPYPP